MVDRLFVDLAADGRAYVGIGSADEPADIAAAQPWPLAWPLDSKALEELRWYLEDYLQTPFGAYESRGPEAAARLTAWGEAVFESVFGSGPGRDVYRRAQARGGAMRIVFRSSSADLLSLPWELMRDPGHGLPVALESAGLDRSLLPAVERDGSLPVSGRRLRVLMVISRPAGAADVGFQMIARPLLERLEAVRGAVDLVVLRPPTLDTLAETLAVAMASGEPFQVVHFDGHGAVASDPDAEGMLIFQGPDGQADPVSASQVAQVLAQARVPVVVLNACQSGAVGGGLEAAVATRVLGEGAASVVAMAYSVYAVAAAEFMAAFYERLFMGETVSSAVAVGRLRMFDRDLRPSVKGDLPLADWMVPVHYMRREIQFPGLVTARTADGPSSDETLGQLTKQQPSAEGPGHGALTPAGAFIGRDVLFYELETALRLKQVAVLHGLAGTGKTELAKAFGRWWRDTGGTQRPEWVFWHAFEPGQASSGLDAMISEIGMTVFGADFATGDKAEQAKVVLDFLRNQRMLLIWDGLDNISPLPDPSAPALPHSEAGRMKLAWFAHQLTSGSSALLITSRTTETWLDDILGGPGSGARTLAIHRIEVSRLSSQEAVTYASVLLAPHPEALPRRAERAFGELMEWLDGHPLTMSQVLPRLATTDAQTLLDELRGSGSLSGAHQDADEQASALSAGLAQSFAHLDADLRRILVVVCLFQGTVDGNVLAIFSAATGVPSAFAGVTGPAWAETLDRAASAGLATRLDNAMYGIHPALPSLLAATWRAEDPLVYETQRAAAIEALLAAYAVFAFWQSRRLEAEEGALALGIVDVQRHTMCYLLRHALRTTQWMEASAIIRLLNTYWNTRGLYAEADAWIRQVRSHLEDASGQLLYKEDLARELWLFCVGAQANRQLLRGQLDAADKTFREILAGLPDQPTSPAQHNNLGTTCHALGKVASERGRLDEAVDWHTKSLAHFAQAGEQRGFALGCQQLGVVQQERGLLDEASDLYLRGLSIMKNLGDQSAIADACYRLGSVAQAREQLDEASAWYNQALAIQGGLGDRPSIAAICHQLGTVAHKQKQLSEAADWYMRSLTFSEQLGDQLKIAVSYYQLGVVAYDRGQLDEAVDWCTRSLNILTKLGGRPEMTANCYQLGLVAYSRGQLDEAADWYTQSLAISGPLDDRPRMALTYSQLGRIAEEQGNPAQALEWSVRCVALFDDVPHPGTGYGPQRLARLTYELGMPALETCWSQTTDTTLPEAVRDYVQAYAASVQS